MKLHLLEALISDFLSTQLKTNAVDWYYPHGLVGHFHSLWRLPDTESLLATYDQCLKSDYSQRWWKRDNYRPKEIMMKLIEADPELASIAWKDLANDAASLDGRLYRFNYYCDELLQLHRQHHSLSVETYHHQDASMVSLYLAGLFPEKYTLYPGLEDFRSFCKEVGSPDIPVIDDLARYAKVTSIVHTFLLRNNNFEKLSALRQDESQRLQYIPFQVTYELMLFAGERNKTTSK
ncbi:MAG TPA: hypothetical protein VFG10_19880 [Saprospiraceae bacterium]|nr:hypothetical protein [Saprospiraceae bacterium]